MSSTRSLTITAMYVTAT